MAFLPGFVAFFISLTIFSSGTKADSLGIKEHKTEVLLKQGSAECIRKGKRRKEAWGAECSKALGHTSY